MSSGKEEKVESHSHDNKQNAYLSENEVYPFLEYNLPLEDTPEIGSRTRKLSKSDGGSSKGSLDAYFDAMVKADDLRSEKNIHNDDGHFPPEDNQKQRTQRDSQHPSHDESVVQSSRQRIPGQSVSFVDEQNTTNNDKNHNNPSKQNRPMEIRMDGHVVQVTHSDDSKNANGILPASGNANLTPQTTTPSESSRAKVDYDMKNNVGDNHHSSDQHFPLSIQGSNGYLDGDISFNTNTSASPATIRPSSSHNNLSISSYEGTSRSKPSSYTMEGALGPSQEVMIPEENPALGVSFDESDVSNITGTTLTRRLKDIFNLHKISILIVKCISCFCCIGNNNELQGSGFPDRFILARLNILSFVFSAIQLAASLWLIVVVFIEGRVNVQVDDDYQHEYYLWNNNPSIVVIACLAFVLLFTCFWTTRIVKEVDLVGALRFLWLLLWILPVAAFLNITAFDYYDVTSAWIRHNWNSIQLWWFRTQFCLPDTADSLCIVPIDGGHEYDSEDDWCFEEHNSTGCTEIRDKAQEKTAFFLFVFYRSLASWGCIYMFIILLMIKTLERIISKPMVQKSKEVNVVGWLTFPVFCTALFGSIILFYPYTYLDKLIQPRWVGYLYLITSGLFFVALLMGWFLSAFSIRSNVDKLNKSNAALLLVVVLFVNAFVLLTILVASFIWSQNLSLTEGDRGDIACTMKSSQCSYCDAVFEEFRCPEWSFEEVTSIVRRQLKQSAVMAAIFILYDVNVMVHAFNLRKHLSMYQIDYV